jgi:hypothetical protein
VALGRCAECDRLLPIQARGNHAGQDGRPLRQQRWYPVRHPRLGDDTGGEDCPGMVVAL